MRCLLNGVMLEDLKVQKYVMIDRCVVLGGILYYVDPVMKDQARLVVLSKKWLEVTYCKGCLTYVRLFLSQSGWGHVYFQIKLVGI